MAETSVTSAPERAAHRAAYRPAAPAPTTHTWVSRFMGLRYSQMAAPPVYLAHHSSLEHDTGAHPEQPARITAIEHELSARDWLGFERRESLPVDRHDLEAVHPAPYIDSVAAAAEAGGAQLDPDTIVSARSFAA